MVNMRAIQLGTALLLLCSGCTSGGRAEERIQGEAVVLDAFARPTAVSGVIAVYAGLTVKFPAEEPVTIFVPYLAEDQWLPSRGERCRVGYRMRPLGGIVGANTFHLRVAPVAEELICGGRSWRSS